ncbi:hypothetical protein [Leifsonia sp. Root112D2]|uniref:hypothetical protein n=1 Tax=Leifsonia sp. Root112D2 TaxID=1736426 RepID=UPI0009EAB8E1|nr:hypothetical protein [Leifsonia sp. Root112D2]
MIADATLRLAVLLTPHFAADTTPPTPPPYENPDAVTPGAWGFAIFAFVAILVIVLAFDLVRRIRRVRYREEIAQKLDAEQGEPAERGQQAERGDQGAGPSAGG